MESVVTFIDNIPSYIYDKLYQTDERFKELIVEYEYAKSIQDDDKINLAVNSIYDEFGKELILW